MKKTGVRNRIPVILDTDIGGDIDDVWALAMMLKCPELDVKLVVSDSGNTEYRARIIARMLEIAGRTDIPVGVGIWQDNVTGAQAPWVDGYDLRKYPGTVLYDGVEAIVRTIRSSAEPMTLIAIGPVPNLRLALSKAPDIADRTTFVGMHGSIRRHHEGKEGAIAEYNVVSDPPACAKVFASPWKRAAITPLDTCGVVRLAGSRYARLRKSPDPVVRAVLENYRIWCGPRGRARFEAGSSILFDTVAVHLAYSTEFLVMERMGVRVDWQGYTRRDESARPLDVAVEWKDLDGYEDDLLERLLSPVVRR